MKRQYHTNLAFLDVLFNTLLCFAALFAMSFILINPSKKDNNVVAKGEFVIVMTWPKEMDNDVDILIDNYACVQYGDHPTKLLELVF